jgi:hypothetical protein
VARVKVLNPLGFFDSLNPVPFGPLGRIRFSVSHNLNNEPNTAVIELFNLSPDTVAKIGGVVKSRKNWTPEERAQLALQGKLGIPPEIIADGFGQGAVELSWGYADSETMQVEAVLSVGFRGQSTLMNMIHEGNDRVFTIWAEDGAQSLGAAEAVQLAGPGEVPYQGKSYAGGTDITDIVADLVNAMGLSVDNGTLAAAIAESMVARGIPPAETKILGGYNASGPARPQLEQFLSALQLRWSIQDGEFIVLTQAGVLPGYAPVVLSTALGNIIGEPETKQAGKLGITTFASTVAKPGRPASVLTARVAAAYRIDTSLTEGDTSSGGETRLDLDELLTLAET